MFGDYIRPIYDIKQAQEILDNDRDLVATFPPPDVQASGLQFFVADHRHVGHLLQLSVADLRLHALAPTVDLDPQIALAEPVGQLADRLDVPVGNRNEDHLDRGQPDGKRTSVALDQIGHESLHRADGGTVDHHRSLHRLGGRDVLEAEAFWHQEVDLVSR